MVRFDQLDEAGRSKLMASIRKKNTKPEVIVRKVAHRLGYRFRLHRADLPGTPDIVFPARKKIIQVHGWFLASARLSSRKKDAWQESRVLGA